MNHLRSAMQLSIALAALATLTPAQAQVDPGRFLDTFESTFGKFDGYRRSGAKGICATGEFIGSADGRALSAASAFSGTPVPVIVRFSVGGANPNAPDNGKSQRNLALQFNLPGGETWQMGNISAPVFGAATPEQFLGRLESLRPDPATKAADPAKVKAFADANPEVLLQGKHFASQPVPASFVTVNYWGVHAFGFVDARGNKRWGKWIFEPVGGTVGLTDDEAKAKGPSFLAADLRDRVKAGTAAFDFNLQLAESGDKLDSAVVPLPAERKKVSLGRLRITDVAPDGGGTCLTLTYIPTQLPKGVEGSPIRCWRRGPRPTPSAWAGAWAKAQSSSRGARHAALWRRTCGSSEGGNGLASGLKLAASARTAPTPTPPHEPSPLTALSPLDGRYAPKLTALRPLLSEFGLRHRRVQVEVEWFIALSDAGFAEFKSLGTASRELLRALVRDFAETDAQGIKEIERTTNHDVKAVEYWLKARFAGQPELWPRRSSCTSPAPAKTSTTPATA